MSGSGEYAVPVELVKENQEQEKKQVRYRRAYLGKNRDRKQTVAAMKSGSYGCFFESAFKIFSCDYGT